MTDLPTSARVVIIGGGISGCSVAYHLAELGWTDVVLLERKQLTSRHHLARGRARRPAAGQPEPDPAREVLGRSLRAARGGDRPRHRLPPVRLDHRGADRGAARGDPAAGAPGPRLRRRGERALARRGRRRSTRISTSTASSPACICPADGQADPANVALALAKGARARGARIVEGVKVTAVTSADGPRHRRRLGGAARPAATSPPSWW